MVWRSPRRISSPRRFGSGDYIEFVAAAPHRPYYGRQRSYWLERNPALARDMRASVIRPALAGARSTQTHRQRVDDNRHYAAGSPLADPWYLAKLSRNGSTLTSISESIELSEVNPQQPARLHLSAWGGLDYPDTAADHAFAVLVNNVMVDQVSFDGVNPLLRSIELPAGVLAVGQNQIQIALRPTAYASDRINIESIEIEYSGFSRASEGHWSVQIDADDGDVIAEADAISSTDFKTIDQPNCTGDHCQRYQVERIGDSPRFFRTYADQVEEVLGATRVGDDWIVAAPGPGLMRAFNEAKPALVHAGLEPLRQLRAVDLLVIALN